MDDTERRIKELEEKVKRMEAVLFGIANDTRFQAKVRAQVITGEHTTNKPTIINKNGKTYNLQTV